jgi:hypothetical protein
MVRGLWFPIVILLFALCSCTTSQESIPVSPSPLNEKTEEPPSLPPEPPLAPPPSLSPEPPSSVSETPVRENTLPKVEDTRVIITQEDYKKTFEEVERVIDELNSIIKAGDYTRWEQYLTPKFIASVMDPENLKKLNEQPLLKRNRIEIKTLYDYFIYVVVPSRASVRLDDLIFTDEKKVKAFMFVRGDPVLIYQLEKIGETWKISIW